MTNHPAVEHCGHQPPSAFDRATECVLRPGHSGSHADETGMRWWERQTAERHTADTITPEALDRLYDRLEDAEADREIAVKNLQNYKGSHLNLQHDYHHALHDVYAMQRLRKVLASWAGLHVIYRNFADDIFRAIGEREPCRGRGNCRWMEADAITDYARAEQAEATVRAFGSIFEGFGRLLSTSARDWGTYRVDAWLWAVIRGWDCEKTEHNAACVHGAMEEMAEAHGWSPAAVAKARRYRAVVRSALDPQKPQPEAAPSVEPELVCNCTWGGLELRRCPVHDPQEPQP